MKISACNLMAYSYKNSYISKNSFAGNVKQSIGIKDKLPNPSFYADCGNWAVDYDERERLGKEYTAKILTLCFDDKGNLNPQIASFLDGEKFGLPNGSGGISQQTIKESLASVVDGRYDINLWLYHGTNSHNSAKDILENGFDPTKTKRALYGPGVYFADEGEALEYSGLVIKAKCEGSCGTVSSKFYEKMEQSDVCSKLAKFIGLNSSTYGLWHAENAACQYILADYVRNCITKDLGYDMFKVVDYPENCYVIFNMDAIKQTKEH